MILTVAIIFGAIITVSPLQKIAAQIPDSFTNLKTLPKDISKKELVDMMKGFTFALGVRCEYCHVGDPEKGLSGFDFPSDEKEHKRMARIMLQMVEAINKEHLAKLRDGEGAKMKVECVTCHHGLSEPKKLETVLAEAYADDGLDAARMKYDSIRAEYYGGHSYDFGERTLLKFADELADDNQTAGAIEFININLEYYPESGLSYYTLGNLYEKLDKNSEALKNYEKALEFFPGAPPILQKIDALKK
ncbi:MAG: c-type cytochrome [candidate division Zixibacteria bacterium]|nr:c-type cytochrome [candidate division Zixibacteria bacterium]